MTVEINEPSRVSVPVPQKKGAPFIGILGEFFRDTPLKVLHDASLEENGLIQLKVGPMGVYLVTDPAIFQHILRDNWKNYRKPKMFYGAVRKLIDNGLVTSEGQFWLRQRRMIQPYMHRKYLAGIAQTMADSISEIIDTWSELGKEPVEVNKQMSRITMNVITKVVFGGDISEAELNVFAHHFPIALTYINRRGFLPFIPQWIPIPGDKPFVDSREKLREVIMDLIAKKRQDENAIDLISMLLNTVDDETNEQMTDEQLFDEALTIFAAGFETTATVLTWLCYALEKHPEVHQKLSAEIDQVLGQRMPTLEDFQHLTYTRLVVSEIMRLYTPVPMLPREAVEDDWIGDHFIPAGSTMVMFFYGLHNNPAVWPEPEQFLPERFTPENVAERHRFAYTPFNAGPRKCIGDEFAMMEAIFATAMIVQRFDLQTDIEGVYPTINTTLKPSKELMVTLQKR